MTTSADTGSAKLRERVASFPALAKLLRAQLAAWPAHRRFLERRFAGCAAAELSFCDGVAGLILRIVGDRLGRACEDYRWGCGQIFREEVYFRRTGSYRHATAAAVAGRVYGDPLVMERYLHCSLLSQVFWSNHTASARAFAADFLPANPPGYAHLDVGPGPGLLLAFAAGDPRADRVAAWDISPSSLAYAAGSLQRLGIARPVELNHRDVLDPSAPDGPTFDSILMSEVLEHVDAPDAALRRAFGLLYPEGRLFVNMPVNSPQPDHVFLLREPEAVVALVADAGFTVRESRFLPATGYTEARARASAATISCVVIAEKAAGDGRESDGIPEPASC